MNYRHIYHAGNFADIIKHCILVMLIDYLAQKPKPFCVLDTHAGIGLYPLTSIEAQKSQEYEGGITALYTFPAWPKPDCINTYLSLLKPYNQRKAILHYPGSPLIALSRLRSQDRLILCELHPEDFLALKKNIHPAERVAMHHMNGYEAMKAFLPPHEGRGLVLIDPPFEKTSEFEDIIEHVKLALAKWRGGMFMIWYPIKNPSRVKQFQRKLQALNFPTLWVGLTLQNAPDHGGLSSCGVAVINPPWTLETDLKTQLMPYLAKALQCDWHVSTHEIK
jgi:23S rRNA (adenine2030-N6)-methyltransferase